LWATAEQDELRRQEVLGALELRTRVAQEKRAIHEQRRIARSKSAEAAQDLEHDPFLLFHIQELEQQVHGLLPAEAADGSRQVPSHAQAQAVVEDRLAERLERRPTQREQSLPGGLPSGALSHQPD